MHTNLRSWRRLSTKLLIGLYGSCAERSFVVLLGFFNFVGVDTLSGAMSCSCLTLMLTSSSSICCRDRFRGDGAEPGDGERTDAGGLAARGERRSPSAAFIGEYLNRAI